MASRSGLRPRQMAARQSEEARGSGPGGEGPEAAAAPEAAPGPGGDGA
jgi:hypothetical protein